MIKDVVVRDSYNGKAINYMQKAKKSSKEKESKVKAVVWKLPSENNDVSFCLQVDGVNLKNKSRISRSLDGWRINKGGYNSKKKYEIYLCYREFSSQAAFVKWGKTFPYPLYEQKRSGRLYEIKKKVKK